MFFATDEPQGQKAVHEKHEIHQRIHQQNPPLAPAGGEGSGVRGPDTLETEHHGEKKIAARCSGCKARVTKKKLTGEPGTAVPGCTAEMTRTDFRALQHSHPQTPVCGSPDTSSGKNTQAAGRAWGGLFTPHPRPAVSSSVTSVSSVVKKTPLKSNPATQCSGCKARATSIRAHSCSFVVQNGDCDYP